MNISRRSESSLVNQLSRSNPSLARLRAFIVLAAWMAYPFFYVAANENLGVASLPLVVIPLVLTGWLYGMRIGIIASILAVPLQTILFQFVGSVKGPAVGPPPPPSLLYVPSISAEMIIGAGSGLISDLFEQLKSQITKREHAEDALRRAHGEMEKRVEERTSELTQANAALAAEIEERKSAEDRLQRRNSAMAHLVEAGDLLLTCRKADEAYAVMAQYGEKLFPGHSGALGIINPSRNLVEIVATWGEPLHEAVFPPDDCWALRLGKIHSVAPASRLMCRHVIQPVETYAWCAPLMAQEEALGILFIRAGRPDPAATLEELDRQGKELKSLIDSTTELLALALVNLKLRNELRNQAIRDPLTGLYNRRYLEETTERELARSARRNLPMGFVMFDIDHFKDLNDSFGHTAGDLVLRELGKVLTAHTRSEDIACRFGGEEFLLVLPDIDVPDLLRRVTHVREEIARVEVTYDRRRVRTITMSGGVAMFPQHGTSIDTLIHKADEALYLAKRRGRDQVVVYEEN